MAAFRQALRDSVIEVSSPDGTLTLRVNGSGQVDVGLLDGCLARHDEQTLGRQVTAAVRLAIAARTRTYKEAFESVADETGPW